MIGPSKKYDFSLNIDSAAVIQNLIARHWYKDHILVREPMLIEDLYLDPFSKKFNFSTVSMSGDVVAFLGYIPWSKFGGANPSPYTGGAIWWASNQHPGAGVALLKRVSQDPTLGTFLAIGISEIAKEIYVRMGWPTYVLPEFFQTVEEKVDSLTGTQFFTDVSDSAAVGGWIQSRYLGRSPQFIRNRFASDRPFDYRVAAHSDKYGQSVAIYRIVELGSMKLLRVLELYSDSEYSPAVAKLFSTMLRAESAGAIDYAAHDLTGNVSISEGTSLKLKSDFPDIAIPNLVSPPVWEWSPTYFASSFHHPFVTRADGDQDRPN